MYVHLHIYCKSLHTNRGSTRVPPRILKTASSPPNSSFVTCYTQVNWACLLHKHREVLRRMCIPNAGCEFLVCLLQLDQFVIYCNFSVCCSEISQTISTVSAIVRPICAVPSVDICTHTQALTPTHEGWQAYIHTRQKSGVLKTHRMQVLLVFQHSVVFT